MGRKRTRTTVREEKGTQTPVGVANLNGLLDWVGMAPRMGPISPVRAHFRWAGLCPEKLVK